MKWGGVSGAKRVNEYEVKASCYVKWTVNHCHDPLFYVDEILYDHICTYLLSSGNKCANSEPFRID